MNNKNIIFNDTLEQYNKKYRNRNYCLLKYTKKEVEQFDKLIDKKLIKTKNFLLKGRKWALIGDTYYEIPKPLRLTWFRNLNAGAQVAICLLGAGVISSSVLFPTLSVTIWNKDYKPVDPEPIKQVDFKTCSWDDVALRCTKLEDGKISENEFYNSFTYEGSPISSKEDFLGKERTVKVNGQDHRVRVIDVQHGKNESEEGKRDLIIEDGKVTNKVASLTFEFANLISDDQGNSLAYQWNDTNLDPERDYLNDDFPNSSLRKILCGNGKFDFSVYCSTKGNTCWDDNYTNKSILSMLPDSLQAQLKVVKKTIRTGDLTKQSDCSDKLFLLSHTEMGGNALLCDEGTVYSYYLIHKSNVDRVKKQVNNSYYFDTLKYIKSDVQLYQSEAGIQNCAGFNFKEDETGGGMYWLRSPWPDTYPSCYIGLNGEYDKMMVNNITIGVAPAFCL